MEERLRQNFFMAVRMGLLLILEGYIALSTSALTGAPSAVLLLLALFIAAMSLKELFDGKVKIPFFAAAAVILIIMVKAFGIEFILLGVLLFYEILHCVKPGIIFYFLPLLAAFARTSLPLSIQLLIVLLLALVYIQNDFVVESYRRQTQEDCETEQHLKHDMYRREHEMQEQLRKNLLQTENQILEEREQLSQKLHDKLGHSINGSIYQLEAIKVLMEKDPTASRTMLQAVIDQMRGGMDEIRAILRKGRPKKYRIAMIQLEKLCEDCIQKGVDATLNTEGDLSQVPEKYLEIILDNAYEAVSNSMKYAKCTAVNINIRVLNQLVRCSISDNGAGCREFVDGMGISGMRRRIREVNGVIDFETEIGFTINMLLPLQERDK
ncbi:MAG: hypothetical protein J6L81_02580 [Clostridia bacterium]|nr:hypothetical protein [Clostridia bacterium]